MKTHQPNYCVKAFFIMLLTVFIGTYSVNAQSKADLKGLPIEESGLSAEEYNDIMNSNDAVKLFSTEGNLTLTLCKVHGTTTNDPKMKHIFVPKDNPNKPQWSAIPYNIIREEDCNENK
jgi:hypothetical protein